jgi:L-lactate utilization protein LutB
MPHTSLETTIAHLEANGFAVIRVATADEAFAQVKTFVTEGIHIGLGGSTTVAQIGLLEWLQNHPGITLSNQYEPGITPEENYQRRREGLLSDLYITGCNAITHAGELVNVDGDGNRVAAQIFGPTRVLLIASTDKIVPTREAAFARIRNEVVPKNIERMNTKARSMGKPPRWDAENIANKYVWIDSDKPGRTTLILVDEPLGF